MNGGSMGSLTPTRALEWVVVKTHCSSARYLLHHRPTSISIHLRTGVQFIVASSQSFLNRLQLSSGPEQHQSKLFV